MAYRCPCCFSLTLSDLPDERCPVCLWKDDDQTGPDDPRLIQARQNYLEFGASTREALPDVRPPEPDEI